MGNFSLAGILLAVSAFLLLFGILLANINVTNPITGNEASIFSQIISWIIP